MNFKDFENRWNSMPTIRNSYLGVDGEHPLSINIGFSDKELKTMIIVDIDYKIQELPISRSILPSLIKQENDKFSLSFQLINKEIVDVFIRFCWDIVEYSRSVSKRDALNKVVNRYIMWQKLLTHTINNSFSKSKQKGLFGELLYLKELFNVFDQYKAISSWSGPEGSDQDFIYDDTWAEVKTTSLASEYITISSLEQLEVTKDGIIIIYFLEQTTSVDSTGRSVRHLINELRDNLENDTLLRDQFDLKLFFYGYKDCNIYEEIYFRYCKEFRYRVTDKFPRLTKKNIPNGVCYVKYGVYINSIEPYRYK